MTRREEITKKALELDTTNDIATFVVAAQWADKTMIDKACEWIKENFVNYTGAYVSPYYIYDDDFVEDFRKAMEK